MFLSQSVSKIPPVTDVVLRQANGASRAKDFSQNASVNVIVGEHSNSAQIEEILTALEFCCIYSSAYI